MAKKAKRNTKKQRPKLIDVVKRELKARGYREVEPSPDGGGQWSPPDSDWADGIMVAIQDCFEVELDN